MDEPAQNYRREFLSSPHHAALGLLTLGAGFISANLLGLIVGATAYALGWIYVPDFSLFRKWVDRRFQSAKSTEEAQRLAEFHQRRQDLLRSLAEKRQERYFRLAQVCRDIENATAENPIASADPATDPRLRKLDELMWTFLRLLGIEESLERFLETERHENIPDLLKDAETEATRLAKEVEQLKASGSASAAETRQRYLNSRTERLEVLRKRQRRIEQAGENLALVLSEQDRLEQQIKLLRADAVATRNAETLTARIDATVEHLDQTNKWLSELDEFKDLVGDMPNTGRRVGYEAARAAQPPPLIDALGARRQTRQKQSQ
ncbi:MAG TPA: hypothetical protein VN673_07335 [Clostridia bacterium]|nr:hypothetical protein [Clostridia bacterium]